MSSPRQRGRSEGPDIGGTFVCPTRYGPRSPLPGNRPGYLVRTGQDWLHDRPPSVVHQIEPCDGMTALPGPVAAIPEIPVAGSMRCPVSEYRALTTTAC